MSIVRRLAKPLQSERLIRSVDRVLIRSRPRPGGTNHVLLAPPGRGNIGDQALVEAFVEAVDGPVVVLTRSTRDFDVPAALASRMRLVPLPALVYGSAVGHARDVRTLTKELGSARSFSVIGADIMDGAYVLRASVNRAALAERLARLGWPTRIVGFSWNSAPHARAVQALRRAGDAGVRLYLRDPRSAARARADGLPVIDSADIVFSASSRDDGIVQRLLPDLGDGRLALVNASGLVGDRLPAYGRVIEALRAAGHTVLVVPHVSRHGADDLPLCEALVEAAGDPQVQLVPRLLAPTEIRGLAARAAITVTGRMHLAVMSLMAGTPAVTVATQGKVEGLMDLFGAPELCVSPGSSFDADLTTAVATVIEREGELRSRILAARDDVRRLSERNVEGL
ncbi:MULTISPECIES: polysaccharide pyruvyl transferase family protein [Microbacterium]|uniref:polysaccharide pyruvyl transferase family protein n=1 Tax=Microbacterium TaxID=33882 RepID=UPI00278B9BC9|nr:MULTISPECIES: polysaccharide pyruvyl transferase family protein [Microbacterium]MDQ1084633.1 colanic acid/amylovoran biosynthesis protein [Microbacterium sp. SORGH_AS_0344]MDQ1170090.1 colanic acid/amylovoran biosynthesis protein [Microbacterium proteolyticum]